MTEEATITNGGSTAFDLLGWRLLSVRGNQPFDFKESLVLQPGSSVIVTTGPNARNQPPEVVFWTKNYIWNSDGDEGQLIDLQFNVVSTTP